MEYYFPTINVLELAAVSERTESGVKPKLQLYELQFLIGDGEGSGGDGGKGRAMPNLEYIRGQRLLWHEGQEGMGRSTGGCRWRT